MSKFTLFTDRFQTKREVLSVEIIGIVYTSTIPSRPKIIVEGGEFQMKFTGEEAHQCLLSLKDNGFYDESGWKRVSAHFTALEADYRKNKDER